MKAFILSILAVITIISSNAYAWPTFPTAQEMKTNYELCEKSDESWHRRWGQYVVAYDLSEAAQICRGQWQPAEPKLTGCRYNGANLWAGYYCEEILGG